MVAEHIEVKLDFIPVDERLPDNGRVVFIRSHAFRYIMDASCIDGEWKIVGKEFGPYATHWAEIPQVEDVC